jgi:hypothetical protein
MAIISFAKIYIAFQKKRANPQERRFDLIVNSIYAVIFSFALIDLLTTLPQIIELLAKIGV